MKVILAIDIQNDFVTGSLGTKEAVEAMPKIIKYLTKEEEKGSFIVFTKDTHYDNYLNTREGKKLPIVHTIKDTWGHEIEDNLRKSLNRKHLVLEKESFGLYNLPIKIEEKTNEEITEFVFLGFCSDICVISNINIIRSYFKEIPITFLKDLSAGVSIESHGHAIEVLKSLQVDIK